MERTLVGPKTSTSVITKTEGQGVRGVRSCIPRGKKKSHTNVVKSDVREKGGNDKSSQGRLELGKTGGCQGQEGRHRNQKERNEEMNRRE